MNTPIVDGPEAVPVLRGLIAGSRRIAIFTGAGISTESGIPDFRSPGGIWTKNQPIVFQDFLASEEMRREAWRRKMAIDETFSSAKPNRGHRAVAELVRSGRAGSVITQNIDGLHQASGAPADRVIELHGNGTYAVCLDCHRLHELAPIFEDFKRSGIPPVCTVCEGIVKTATISFGQSMPEEPMRRARDETLACDLFLTLGSSLSVFPAASFPAIAKENGATLIIINREPTPLDAAADLVLHTGIGDALGEAVGVE